VFLAKNKLKDCSFKIFFTKMSFF